MELGRIAESAQARGINFTGADAESEQLAAIGVFEIDAGPLIEIPAFREQGGELSGDLRTDLVAARPDRRS